MGAFDALFGRVFSRGSQLELKSGLNFKGGLKATPNLSTGLIDIDGGGGTTVIASFVQPNVDATVDVTCEDTSTLFVGEHCGCAVGGAYVITEIADATHLTIQNTGASGNASPGTDIPSGILTPVGSPGSNGAAGPTGAPGKGLAPVRAVQTAALTSWVYDNAAGTLTAPANGALPSPWPAFDNITTPATTDAGYEVNTLGVANVQNGVYALTSVGSVSTKAVLTRRPDLDSNADFAGGASFDVLDGASTGGNNNAGTRRYLATAAAVVLGTTQLAFAAVREKTPHIIDTTKGPYLIVGQASQAAAVTDYATQINQAIADCYALGGGVVQLPAGAYGWVRHNAPLIPRDNVTLRGGGKDATHLVGFIGGGAQILVQNVDAFPDSSTVVDALSDHSFTFQNGLTPGQAYWLNLTRAGMWLDTWAGLSCEFDIIYTSDGGNGSTGGHVASCGGRQFTSDALSKCFEWTIKNGQVIATLRASGGSRTLTSTFSGGMVAGHKYYCAIDYDSNTSTMYLHLGEIGGGINTNVVSGSLTGTVSQNNWEETHFGSSNYNAFPEASLAPNGIMFNGLLGAIRFSSTTNGRTAGFIPPTSVSSAAVGGGTLALYMRAHSTSKFFLPGDLTRAQGYKVTINGSSTPGFANTRRGSSPLVPNAASVENLELFSGGAFAVSGIHAQGATQFSAKHVRVTNCFDGIALANNCFTSTVHDLVVTQSATRGGNGLQYSGSSGVCTMSDFLFFGTKGSYGLVGSGASFHQFGKLYLAPTGAAAAAMLLTNTQGVILDNLLISAENGPGLAAGAFIDVAAGCFLEMKGDIAVSSTPSAVPAIVVGGSSRGKIRYSAGRMLVKNGAVGFVSVLDASVPITAIGDDVILTGTSPLCDMLGKVVFTSGARPKNALADAAATTLTPIASSTRYEMTNGVTSQVNAITLGVASVREGFKVRFRIAVQGNNVTIANGGGGGGTLATITAGQSLVVEYWFDGTNWVLY